MSYYAPPVPEDFPAFPIEVVDRIVDHLHDDTSSLQACALTCRIFRPGSQFHLLRSLRISSLNRLHNCVQLLEEQPRLALYVQELHFWTKYEWQFRVHPTWISSVAPTLSPLLPNVRTLAFDYVEWVWPDYELPDELVEQVAQFRNVTELRFYACNFSEFLNIDKFTTAFPRLSRVFLNVCGWQNDRLEHINPRLSLTSIHFGRHVAPITPMLWLEQTPSVISLRDVSFSFIGDREAPFVGKFFRALGPSLKRLKLGCRFESDEVMQNIDRIITLVPLTSLTHLHLAIPDLDLAINLWVPHLLAQAVSLPLQSLGFDLWLHYPTQLHGGVWDLTVLRIQSLVLRPSPTLKEITIVHRGDLRFETARRALQQRMMFVHHREMLRVVNRQLTG